MSAAGASEFDGTVLALSGGIGGAKLALGLDRVLAPGKLMVLANTGDDFEHLGLTICPDIDTLLYTLAGVSNEALGWGRRGETWTFMAALEKLGGESWFRLGDGDLATHVERTRRLAAGESLSAITDDFRRRLGIGSAILPMTDQPVRTRLDTDQGRLDFQDYFVRRRCAPAISRIDFAGAREARPNETAMAALAAPGPRAVVICPSNPFISIEPILALPGMREALAACRAPVISVCPIIGGKAVKGPTDKMMAELGLETTAAAASRRYLGLLDAVLIDEADAAAPGDHGAETIVARTLMRTEADKIALAHAVLAAADRIAARQRGRAA